VRARKDKKKNLKAKRLYVYQLHVFTIFDFIFLNYEI